jgi:hypothetical protein
MPRRRPLSAMVSVLLAPFLLTACAGGAFQAQYPIVRMQTPDGALTRFTDPALQNARQVHVSDLEAFEYVDYSRYETPDVVLESVYDVANSESTVLQYGYWMSRAADTWNLNQGQPITWGEAGTVQAWHGAIDYQPYRLTATGRDCVAFNDEWDIRPQDIQTRPTRVFFGYICAQPGKQLATAKATAIIASVRFSGRSPESLVPVDSRHSVDEAAFAAAKGVPGGTTGNSKFPFNFGTVYVEGSPDQRNP